jgi:hypothetical protein
VTAYERPQIITDTGSIQAEDAKEGCPRCGGKVSQGPLSMAVGKTTLMFSANVNILSVSATLPACWYHAKWKISGKYVHGNRKH